MGEAMLCRDCGEYFYLMVIKSKYNKVCTRKPIANTYLNTLVWTTLIIGYFYVDYQLVNYILRTKLHTEQITGN